MTSNDLGAEIFLALGANIPSRAGPPAETLKAALVRLGGGGVAVLRLSPFYETVAWPDPADPPFTNAVAAVATSLPPFALMTLLHAVETEFGRERSTQNAPRTLDLDLLDYRGQVLDGSLVLPHPRMAQRGFVLRPLRDVAPGWRHPVTGATVAALIAALPQSPFF